MSKYYYTIYGLNIESEIELSELIEKDNRMSNIDVSILIGEELEDLTGRRWEYKNKQNIFAICSCWIGVKCSNFSLI